MILAMVVTVNEIDLTSNAGGIRNDNRAYAAVLYSQDITLAPGWNIMSTPKVVESHRFSMSESVANFDVYVLNANSTSSWSTMSDLGQSEFTPLYGYFINNKSSTTQTLTFNYKASTTPSQRLFERNFSKSGWYSVGVANEDLSLSSEVYNIDTNNPSQIFNTLIGKVSNYIDLVDPNEYSTSTPGLTTDDIPNEKLMVGLNSHRVGNTWMSVNGNNLNSLTDLRDTKGYIIYLDASSANYVGYQDDVVKDVVHTPAIISFEVATTGNMVTIYATDTYQSVWNANFGVGYSSVDLREANFYISADLTNIYGITDYKLVIDGKYFESVSTSSIDISGDLPVGFRNLTSGTTLAPGVHNIQLLAKINNASGYFFAYILQDKGLSTSEKGFVFFAQNSTNIMLKPFMFVGDSPIVKFNAKGDSFKVINRNDSIFLVSDPSFQATNVVAGASNQTIAKYTLTAYGEDTRVQYLTVSASSTGISNVGIYVNGSQVGSNYNFAMGSDTVNQYSLGSNFIALVGEPNTVEIKGDLVSPAGGNAYGFVSASISALQIYGLSSQITYSHTFTPTVRTLEIGNGSATLNKNLGFSNQNITPNSSNVKIGSFTIQAGSAEGVVVKNINVGLMGLVFWTNHLSNLVIKESGSVVGTPIGVPVSQNNISANITVVSGASKTFDVYADIGTSSIGMSVLIGMQISYRGVLSNVSNITQIAIGTVTTIALPIITANDVTLGQDSPVSQFVVGGSHKQIATFNVKAANDIGGAIIRELAFNVPTNTISSITVNGTTASVVGSMAVLYGLNIVVPAGSGGVNIPIEVTFVCIGGTGCIAPTAYAKISIAYFTYLSGNNTVVVSGIQATSREMILVGSKPTVIIDSIQKTGLVLGAENKIGEVTIAADAAGGIKVNLIPFSLNTSGIDTPEFTSMRIAEGNVTITGSSCTLSGMCSFGNSPDGYVIPAGTSKTFSLYGTVTGTATASTVVTVSSSVIAPVFTWEDMVGGGIGWLGTPIYNFPTNSYSIRQ